VSTSVTTWEILWNTQAFPSVMLPTWGTKNPQKCFRQSLLYSQLVLKLYLQSLSNIKRYKIMQKKNYSRTYTFRILPRRYQDVILVLCFTISHCVASGIKISTPLNQSQNFIINYIIQIHWLINKNLLQIYNFRMFLQISHGSILLRKNFTFLSNNFL